MKGFFAFLTMINFGCFVINVVEHNPFLALFNAFACGFTLFCFFDSK